MIRPSIVIRSMKELEADSEGQLAFRPPECSPEDIVRVLDREQERLAHHLASGTAPFVVRPVAGRRSFSCITAALAEHFPDRKYLILCYNIPLSKVLEAEVVDLPNISVLRVDVLALQLAPGRRNTADELGPSSRTCRSAPGEGDSPQAQVRRRVR